MPTTASIDHLVIAATTLAEGRSWVEQRLGVPMTDGGRHRRFGTHNAVLGCAPDVYLEVIAIDPDAEPPDRPRWFALDDLAMRARLALGPALIHWVMRVDGLDGPEVLELSRDDIRWRLTVSPDGSLPMGGAAPSCLEWLSPPPSSRLPDQGVRLERLRLTATDPDALRDRLRNNGFHGPVEVIDGPPAVHADLVTPSGLVDL